MVEEININTELNTEISPDKLFPGVLDQIKIKRLLLKVLNNNRLSHSYLFIGGEGSGRFAMAIEVARILNCEFELDKAIQGCACNSCKHIKLLQHPNLLPIFPLPPLDKEKGEPAQKKLEEFVSAKANDPYTALSFEGTGKILVDQIRDIRNRLNLAQDRRGTRVVIIHPADRMNEQASNALLKLLEEPPDRCILLLTTTSLRNVLPTIISRCQPLTFANLSVDTIKEALINKLNMDPREALKVAVMSNGSYTRALELVSENALSNLDDGLNFLRNAVTGNTPKIAEQIQKWTEHETRQQIVQYLNFTARWIRDAMRYKSRINSDLSTLNLIGDEQVIDKLSSRYSIKNLQKVYNLIEESRLALDSNATPQLVILALAVNIKRILK